MVVYSDVFEITVDAPIVYDGTCYTITLNSVVSQSTDGLIYPGTKIDCYGTFRFVYHYSDNHCVMQAPGFGQTTVISIMMFNPLTGRSIGSGSIDPLTGDYHIEATVPLDAPTGPIALYASANASCTDATRCTQCISGDLPEYGGCG